MGITAANGGGDETGGGDGDVPGGAGFVGDLGGGGRTGVPGGGDATEGGGLTAGVPGGGEGIGLPFVLLFLCTTANVTDSPIADPIRASTTRDQRANLTLNPVVNCETVSGASHDLSTCTFPSKSGRPFGFPAAGSIL